LNGLETAAVILLLISEDGIKGIEGAHERQDNVLLEYEFALEKHEKGTAVLLPLMVGKYVDGGLYKPFGAFGTSQYADAKHASPKSVGGKTVRQIMETLFKIQGLKTDPSALGDRVKDISGKIQDALKKYGRMGEAKTEETYQDKWTSTWTVRDVQAYLKDSGLDEFAATFKSNAVDGTTFMALDEEMLTKELGVTKKLHVMKILKYIEEQKAAEAEEEEDDEEDEEGDDGEEDEGSSKKKKKDKEEEEDGGDEE